MRRPVWVLYVFVLGLALHNFVMAGLWNAGLRGTGLSVVSAWKEVLLAFALVLLLVVARGRLPFAWTGTDWLALAFAGIVVVYALIPQHWLGGGATYKGVLFGLRHDLVLVGAYFLGRGLRLTLVDMKRIGAAIVVTAVGVAVFGLFDIYAIPLSWWRRSGAPGWFHEQLGFTYHGLSYLPENFIYNTGNEHPLRRLVSTFLSPLASSYLLVVALILMVAWFARSRPRGWMIAVFGGTTALLFAALLLTHSRSSYLALALGLVVFAVARRQGRWVFLGAAVAVVVAGAVFVKAYPHIAPATTFTRSELAYQRSHAQGRGPAVGAGGAEDTSTASHWQSLKTGISTVVHHPQGFGLGNAGATAARTNVTIRAGESTYTEVGADTGLVGALVFIAWSLALLRWALRCWVWIGASLAAVLALGVQTDVIGVPWLAYVLWALAGACVLRTDL